MINVHSVCGYVSAEELNAAQSPEENKRNDEEDKQKLNGSSPEKSLVHNSLFLCFCVQLASLTFVM